MQPTGAAPSPRPPSPALFQPADLFDLSLPVSKMAAMAMSTDDAKRAALRSQIVTRTRQQELLGHTSETVKTTLLNAVQQHIDKTISRLGLADVLAFDIGDDLEAGLKAVYLLERGSGEEWRAMGPFLRLAFIHRLTPADATRPLHLSADSLPTATNFHQLPLAMAIYKTVGHLLIYTGTSLALQHGNDGLYRIGHVTFRVVPFGDLPGGHRYADGYKRTDPVIRGAEGAELLRPNWLFSSFSTFLLASMLFWWWDRQGVVRNTVVLTARIGRDNPRFGRLLTDNITEDLGIAVDYCYDQGNLNAALWWDHRRVIVSGFQPNEKIAASLFVWCPGTIQLWTSERPAADARASVADRFPGSVPLWCAVLRRFEIESDVIDRAFLAR
ncbi:unnamed protein product [Vitrella brassicaformis CCMP3155]|uniref:Uncharacterized protein n=1 Tax=Vitrella brassicaformis (strain CCMP3155) TaxID=1169540 RepID=A0A0G4EL06_VITBC|nr:unnamed protein product [Vitrella brassicaformis CCMP3155]|eukprot:CEL97669.1 unnamed protein product [Vitrella brassicaformis CCMP3155]